MGQLGELRRTCILTWCAQSIVIDSINLNPSTRNISDTAVSRYLRKFLSTTKNEDDLKNPNLQLHLVGLAEGNPQSFKLKKSSIRLDDRYSSVQTTYKNTNALFITYT